jgi:hypothetical protein
MMRRCREVFGVRSVSEGLGSAMWKCEDCPKGLIQGLFLNFHEASAD